MPSLLGLAVWLAFLWPLNRILTAPDRGIEPSDEGLAFLFVQHPERLTGGLPAFGWMTRPLWLLADGDVATFRMLAGWAALVLSALIGLLAVRLVRRLACEADPGSGHAEDVWGVLAGTSAGLLVVWRSPSYPWVNSIGLGMAVLGLLVLLARPDPRAGDRRRQGTAMLLLGAGLLGVGAFVTLGGRPTTGPAVVAVGLVLVGVVHGLRAVAAATVTLVVAAIAAVTAAVAGGLWPQDVLRRLVDAILTITGSEVRSIGGAVVDLLRTPVDVLVAAPLLSVLVVVPWLLRGRASSRARTVLLAGAASAAVGWVGLELLGPSLVRAVHAGQGPPQLVAMFGGRADYSAEFYVGIARALWRTWALIATTSLLVAATVVGSGPRRRDAVAFGLVFLGVVSGARTTPPLGGERLAGSLLLMLAGLAVATGPWWSRRTVEGGSSPARRRLRSPLALTALGLLAVAAVSGFGSGSRPASQLMGAAPVILAAGILLVGALPPARRIPPLAVLTVAVTFVALLQNQGWRDHPYRSLPLADQTVPVIVGPGGSPLLVDDETARLLDSLSEAAHAAGWSAGTRLWEVPIRSVPLLAWHLDADVAANFVLWWGQTSMLDDTFTRIAGEEWADAWLLTSGTGLEDPVDLRRRVEVVSAVTSRLGTSFPADYERVWEFDSDRRWLDLELWRPARAAAATDVSDGARVP